MTRTSASLLGRLREAADQAAWERFVDIYGPLIYRWLRDKGLQDQDAQDVAQEVMLTVMREMPKFHYDPKLGSFRGWLRGVVSHQALMFWRSRHGKPAGAGGSEFEHQLENLARSDSVAAQRWDEEHNRFVAGRILALIQAEFEPTSWQAFWRVVVDGEKASAVAAALGISVNAVYLAKSRVLRRLQEQSEGLLD